MNNQRKQSLLLREFLPYRLSLVTRRVSDSLSSVYEEQFGISIAEWRILVHLGEKSHQNAKDLGKMTSMDKSMVSRAIKLMEEKGYLLREKSPVDNRASCLSLSAQGVALYQALIPRALEWEADLLEALSAPEYRDLLKMLAKLENKLAEQGDS